MIQPLAEAGFRVVAPQIRGYQATSQPANRRYYMSDLAGDVAGWMDELGAPTAHIIGHDWGAAIGYAAAAAWPRRITSLTTLAVPHLRHFRQRLWRHPKQLGRSWYMLFFQLPWLPERAIRAHRWKLLRRLISTWSPGWNPPDDWWKELVSSFEEPGVLPGALGYYRRIFDWLSRPGRQSVDLLTKRLTCPVHLLMGANDGCMSASLSESMMDAEDFTGGLTRTVVPDTGHFLHLEAPETVLDHFVSWWQDQGLLQAS